MKMRLTAKLLIPLVSLVVLGLSVSIFAAYMSSRNSLETAITEQIVGLSDSMASKINTWVDRNRIDMETWSKMDVMTKSLGEDAPEIFRQEANARMKAYIDTHKIFSGMRLADDKGMVIASSTASNVGSVNVESRDYFQNSMQGKLYLSQPLISSTSGKPILVISAPV